MDDPALANILNNKIHQQ